MSESDIQVFELARTFEARIPKPREIWIRADLLVDMSDPRHFRCRLVRSEFFSVKPSFDSIEGQDSSDEPRAARAGHADEELWADWSFILPEAILDFTAEDIAAAASKLLGWIREMGQR